MVKYDLNLFKHPFGTSNVFVEGLSDSFPPSTAGLSPRTSVSGGRKFEDSFDSGLLARADNERHEAPGRVHQHRHREPDCGRYHGNREYCWDVANETRRSKCR